MRGPDRNHDGRVDHRDAVTPPAANPAVTQEIRRDAYERGRADERSRGRKRGFPRLLTFLLLLAAVVGIVVTVLAIREGSFSEAGRTLDSGISDVGEDVAEVGREVADETGEALQDGGRAVERVGEGGGEQGAAAPAGQPAPERR
jgi:hypothetical protein